MAPVRWGNTSPDLASEQEELTMARHRYADEDERIVDEDHDREYIDERPRRGGIGKVLLVLLVVAVAVVIGFFALGGDADVDSEGDLDVPDIDVDINPPDVDTEDAPPADAEANAND
jgi:hypothetical protein